ncbi:MAG: [FeFe] hydrogenase H-cluster radical SAM maturase HydE, partial [Eubacteriales bacterium]
MIDLTEKLKSERTLPDAELKLLLEGDENDDILFRAADWRRREIYGDEVYIRGLIEFTNYCSNNCYYCGIRRDNRKLQRYRLSKEEILSCCEEGYRLGFRTFVLQGGEDPYYTDSLLCDIISEIRSRFDDCAITLSFGEKSKASCKAFFDAGANRYLLRHETANDSHYRKLHPENMSLNNRKQCLYDLKDIGYQVGSGFMVGSPYQTTDMIIEDIRFLQDLQPDMIGIGPYITHQDTPFSSFESGSLVLTLRLIAILRLAFPYALIPATTALGTIHPQGRELGLKAGANVVMPNLSPVAVRKLYTLYENKICTSEESAQCRGCLERR